VIAIIKMSGNRLVSIIANNCTPMLTSAARDAVDEMGGGAREMVLDVKFRFRCRNNIGGIYKITGFTFRRQARKSAYL
jgi:hypothetical protein